MFRAGKAASLILAAVLFFLFSMSAPPCALSGCDDSGAVSAAAFGERFGVSSPHMKMWSYQTMENELRALDGLGVSWVRCNFAWFDLELSPGEWGFEGTDLLVDRAEEHGVNILGILGGSPTWANGGNPPNFPPTDMAAWRNYVRTVCSRYRGRVAVWEIWNEENIAAYWAPGPDTVAYTALLEAASQEIREVDPGVMVMMGGLAGVGIEYLYSCLELGAADYIDAVAYHPYPETLGSGDFRPQEAWSRQIVSYMRRLISSYTTKDIQLWITEFGWTTSTTIPPGVDYQTQADYMLRTLISYADTDLDRVFWYSLRDDANGSIDRYGLLKNDFAPKPSYHYYAVFQNVFGGAVSPEPGGVSCYCSRPGTLEAHCFRRGDGSLAFAAWKSDDGVDELSVTVSDPAYNRLLVVDPVTGERKPVEEASRDAQGKLSVSGLSLGRTPLILEARVVPTYSVTVTTAEGHGKVEPSSQVVLEGDAAIIDFIPDTDYRVASIIDNGVEVPVSDPYVIDGVVDDHEVVVTFKPDRTAFFFAEGYTGPGFEEWLTLANPAEEPTQARITYMFRDGSTQTQEVSLGATTRQTVDVNAAVGPGKEVSIKVEADAPIVAERPMYFNYKGAITGGHDVVGCGS